MNKTELKKIIYTILNQHMPFTPGSPSRHIGHFKFQGLAEDLATTVLKELDKDESPPQAPVTDRRLGIGQLIALATEAKITMPNNADISALYVKGWRDCEDRLLKESPPNLHKENLVKGNGEK